MPHIAIRSRGAAAITPLVLALACLGLGACGGSSSPSTTTTTAVAATTAATTPASTPPPSTATTPTTTAAESAPPTAADKRRRQIALRVVKCFQSNGVTLPAPNAKGYITVSTAASTGQFKVALAKCKPVFKEAASLAGKK
jgi:hypothetical protein